MATKTEKDLWIEMSICEIETQIHFAEIAYSHIDPRAESGNDAVFFSIHSFLSHCAMVSKMLVAVDDGVPPRSIGDVLGIFGDSLVHQRVFRNHLEHYDERLKTWIRQYSTNSTIGTYNIGRKSSFQIPDMVFISHYDPNNQMFTFVNDDFDLGAMFFEVQRIKGAADNWVKGVKSKKINPPFI